MGLDSRRSRRKPRRRRSACRPRDFGRAYKRVRGQGEAGVRRRIEEGCFHGRRRRRTLCPARHLRSTGEIGCRGFRNPNAPDCTVADAANLALGDDVRQVRGRRRRAATLRVLRRPCTPLTVPVALLAFFDDEPPRTGRTAGSMVPSGRCRASSITMTSTLPAAELVAANSAATGCAEDLTSTARHRRAARATRRPHPVHRARDPRLCRRPRRLRLRHAGARHRADLALRDP